MLKLEDWDLTDHEKFPRLAIHKYMTKIYYEEMGLTQFEPMKWVHSVEQAGLLYILLMKHYHHSAINTVCVRQLLTLVHDGVTGISTLGLLVGTPTEQEKTTLRNTHTT